MHLIVVSRQDSDGDAHIKIGTKALHLTREIRTDAQRFRFKKKLTFNELLFRDIIPLEDGNM